MNTDRAFLSFNNSPGQSEAQPRSLMGEIVTATATRVPSFFIRTVS